MKKLSIFLLLTTISGAVCAQIDPTLLKSTVSDTSKRKTLNMDAIYQRPFLNTGKLPVSIGGYMEANWHYAGTDGVSDGQQCQLMRLTLFVANHHWQAAQISSRDRIRAGGEGDRH